jgi:pyruvate dehydrogenase (quinone)
MGNNVADDLVRLLVQAGATRIYGPAGDGLTALAGATRRSAGASAGGVDWVQVDDEDAAAFAASAHAQSTGRLAVCAGSCGPGNARLMRALMQAHRPGAPVLALASCTAARQIGAGFCRNCRPADRFRQAGHRCELVSVPGQLNRRTRLAMGHAVGRGGAAVLVLAGELLTEPDEIRKSVSGLGAADAIMAVALRPRGRMAHGWTGHLWSKRISRLPVRTTANSCCR